MPEPTEREWLEGLRPEDEEALHPDRPWHDDWVQRSGHGDHHPAEDCLRCYAARLWSSYEALRQQNALLGDVAHRAWHLLDDGGEQDDDPEEFVVFMSDARQLSDALDALEATGWDGCAAATESASNHPVAGRAAASSPASTPTPTDDASGRGMTGDPT